MHSIGCVGNRALSEACVSVCDEPDTVRKEGRVRDEIGDVMNKFKKAAAVAAMVGGLGLVGSGVASAAGGDYDDPYPFDIAINNLQAVDCDQDFDGGTAFGPVTGAVTGDNEQNIGNFCTVVGSIGD